MIGFFFIVSGTEKLLSHYQNFLYVVQSYDFANGCFDLLAARLIPWFELFLGVFLVLGLWLVYVLQGLILLVGIFIFIVGQAILRQLPIHECGCFGGLVSLPLHVVIVIDTTILFILWVLLRRLNRTSSFSLDRYFQKSS